jgi:hypothetical protein
MHHWLLFSLKLSIWVGNRSAEIPSLDKLIPLVAPHAQIPDAIIAQLQEDQKNSSSPTPMQLHFARLLSSS